MTPHLQHITVIKARKRQIIDAAQRQSHFVIGV
jgi:hypothetical protein